MTLKAGVMMLIIQLCIMGINYILKCITIKKTVDLNCNNISRFYSFYCTFNQITAALVSRKYFFQKLLTNPKLEQ